MEANSGFANPLAEERLVNNDEPAANGAEDVSTTSTSSNMARVYVESLSASWSYRNDKKVLHNVTFEVNQVSEAKVPSFWCDLHCHFNPQDIPLLAIVGPVGSGKVRHSNN